MLTDLVDGLNDRQAAFVRALVDGRTPGDAARVAGYSDDTASVSRIINSPAVAAAVHQGVGIALQRDAPINLKVLRKIRDDETAPARVRADIGIKLLALAGFVQPSKGDGKASKPISEMSQAELIDFVASNQAAIERAESELAAKAKDVTPGVIVPDSVPVEQGEAPNSLNYLD